MCRSEKVFQPRKAKPPGGNFVNDPEPSPQTEGETRCAMWDREISYRF